jgi:amino acid transporter
MGFVNIGSGVYLVFSSTLAFAPAFNLVLSFLIATVMNLFVVLVYTQMSVAMPRAGGDYIFISRTISPYLGFANNFFFTVVGVLGIAFNAYFAGTVALSGAAAAAGFAMNNQALISIASVAGTPMSGFIVGFVITVFAAVINILGRGWLKKTNSFAFIVGMAAVIAWIVVLATTSTSTFVSSFNSFARPYTNSTDSYSLLLSQANQAGFSVPSGSMAMFQATLLSLPVVYFTMTGANSLNFVSGEIKDVRKNIIFVSIAALGIVAVVVVLLGYLLFNMVGQTWLAAVSYLAFNTSVYTLPSAPTLPLLVSLANTNPVIIWLTFFGVILWGYLLVAAWFVYVTRNIFAYSFDRLIPTSLSDVSPKTSTPVKAIVLITGLSFVVLAVYSFSPAFSYTNFTTAFNSIWIVPPLIAAAWPFMRKEQFSTEPSYVKAKIGPLPLITLFGVLGSLSVIYIDYVVAANPGYAGISPSNNTLSLVIIVLLYVAGLILFPLLKWAQKKNGIDLDMIYKVIPPE